MITCCKDCNKRHPGCHDACPDYILQKKEFEKRKEAMRKDKINTYDICEGIDRLRRKQRFKKKEF